MSDTDPIPGAQGPDNPQGHGPDQQGGQPMHQPDQAGQQNASDQSSQHSEPQLGQNQSAEQGRQVPEGSENAESSDQEQMTQFLRSLYISPAEERNAFLSTYPPDQQKMLLALAEQQRQKDEQEARSRVHAAEEDDGKTVDDKVKTIAPDLSDEEKNTYHALDDLMREQETPEGDLPQDRKDKVKAIFQQKNFTKEAANKYLEDEGFNLNPDVKKELTEGLKEEKEMPEGELTEKERAELARRQAETKALNESLEQFETKADQELVDIAKDPTLSDEDKKKARDKVLRTKGQIASLTDRIREFLHPDTKTGKITRISGKIIYYAILTAFILIVLEMNLMNKAAGQRGNR